MGTQTKAICRCGYSSSDILIGGGKMNFQHTHYYPCLCLDCKDVVQVNLKGNMHKRIDLASLTGNEKFDKPIEIPLKDRVFICPECKGENVIPYYDERLRGEYKESEFRTRLHSEVPAGLCYCPKCDKKTLKFVPSILMWD